MLKFKPEHQPMIVYGKKRETRRMWDEPRVHPGEIHEAWAYEPGTTRKCTFCWGQFMDPIREDIACRWCGGTGKLEERPFAKLLITEVFTQKISELTDEDAQAEGYHKAHELWDALMNIYGVLELQREMVVVRFELEEVVRYDVET